MSVRPEGKPFPLGLFSSVIDMDHDTEWLETLTFANHLMLLGCTTASRSLTLTANRRHFYGDATTSLNGYKAHSHAAALLTSEHGHTGKAKSAVSDVGVKKLAKIMLGQKLYKKKKVTVTV